jgi:nitrogen fixation protein FixH
MKNFLILIITAIFFVGTSYAAPYVIEKQVDDLTVKVVMESNPPVVGENNIEIQLTDSEGNPVKEAKLKLDYSMPPMENMPPMMYRARAKLNGESYKTKINLSMSGYWDIAVNIKRPGKSLAKINFRVTVP